MDFALSAAQKRHTEEIVAYARERFGPPDAAATTLDADGWRALGQLGALGWPIPVEYGGAGLDPLSCVLAYEALGYGCADNGLVFAANNHVWACASYLLNHGTAAQKARYLPGLAAGSLVGAHALTEWDAGSDIRAMSTLARPDGDGFVVTGTKTFVSNAPCADLFVLFAREADDTGADGLTAFLLPRDTPGVAVRRSFAKAGLNGCPMGELTLQDARLPGDAVLGRPGGGYHVFLSTIEWERGFMFASPVGVQRRLLEMSVGRANTRRQFGRSIGAHQAVSHKIADMRLRLESARLLLYRFGWLRARNRLAMLESSMLKLHVSEGLLATSLAAMQIHGARGYLADFGVESEVRDALGTTLYAGTSEIHRSIIAALSGVHDAH